jgi:ABC-2 type transport system permease protein
MSHKNENQVNNLDNIKKTKKPKFISDSRARSLRIFSIGSVVVVCALLLVVNIFLDTIAGDKLTLDLTDTKSYSIGDISKELVSNLDQDVEIVGLFELTQANENIFKDFVPLLADYEKNSDGRISVRYVDPIKFPSIFTEIDPNSTIKFPKNTENYLGYFIVKCGDKVKLIYFYDCYSYDPQYQAQYGIDKPISNNVESTFTGIISLVTSKYVPTVYFTTNHGEDSSVNFSNLITSTGILSADLSTISLDAIPEDCSLLIINNPQLDLFKEDIPLITSYISRGGNVMVVSDYSSAGQELTNLNEVLHYVNINLTNSRISENEQNYRTNALSGYESYLEPTGQFQDLASRDFFIYCSFMRGIDVFYNPKSYIAPEKMLITSTNAVLEENGDPTKTGVAGTQCAAMYSLFTGGKAPGEVAVFGSTDFIGDAFISSRSNNPNTAYFMSVALTLIGETNTVQVPVKEIANYNFKNAPTASVQSGWSIVLVAAIPLSFVIIGIVVYKRRKNK